MHFSSLALPLLATVGSVAGRLIKPTVTVYTDGACKHQNQQIVLTTRPEFMCYEFKHPKSQSVRFSKRGFTDRAWAVWDDRYCDGDPAGDLKDTLGECLSAADYGVAGWYSAHISPR